LKQEPDMNRFYKTNERYFSRLREKEFRRWFLKYYIHLRDVEGSLVLDVGCGVGQVVNRLAADGLAAIGLDISPIGIKNYSKRNSSQQASFIVASCYSMPFRENVFDSVGCLGVLEHLENPEVCIDEMMRVTRESGKIILVGPNLLCPVYASDLKSALGNAKMLFQRILWARESIDFEHKEPILDDSKEIIEKDLDAVTLTDSATTGRLLTEKGLKITYNSSYLGTRRIVEALSRLPLLRSVGGGIFLVARKTYARF